MNRAFEQNNAAQSDHIYGDTFTVNENKVEGIGNNVSLEFENMDFSDNGTSKIVIYGRSPIDKNTIHIKFENNEGQSNQIIEFTYSDKYEEKVFELKKIKANAKSYFYLFTRM